MSTKPNQPNLAKSRATGAHEFPSNFDELPDAEKERIWQEIDRMTPEEHLASSRPLTKRERAEYRRDMKRRRR